MSRDRAGASPFIFEPARLSKPPSTGVKQMLVEKRSGRVLVGPKKLHEGYARIVSNRDGSGRIESFDPVSRTWIPAPESITFSEIWSAPAASILI
jgi:hypothetical protein